MRHAWKLWLGLASVVTATYFLLPNTPESKLVLYNGVGFLAVVLLLVGIWRNRIAPRAPWLFFAAGLASFLVADIIYYVLEITNPEGPPYPSIADCFYLAMYPLVMIGLTKLVRHVAPGGDKTTLIDAAVVATAMFGSIWVLFVDDVVTAELAGLALITSLAYPVLDVALLAVAARLAVSAHLRHPPLALMLLGIGSLAVADIGYNIYLAAGTFHTGLFIDAFWLGFYACFAAAALHPASAVPGTQYESHGRLTGRQLVIMILATLGLPTIDLLWGTSQDRVVTIITSALLFILILIRVFALMQALQRGQDQLRHDAEHDALTGLSNRVRFADRVEAALEERGPGHVAVLFVDLDDFKTVNDSLGHQAGDMLLAEVANRLETCVRHGDTVARFGGDEFAMLLESAVDRQDAVSVARRALAALSEPIDLQVRTVRASASIGIAMHLDADQDVEALMRNADVAMYLSKTRGKGRYSFFEPAMHEEAIERLDLKADLQRAIDEEQFTVHYQPIFDLDTGKVALVEALLRWRHPTRGMISPDRFIPLAEENGLIVPIGEWVLREACLQAVQWHKIAGCEEIGVTVNLSMRQLHDSDLVNALTNALRDSGLPARNLLLEITESMLAIDAELSASVLEQLKTIGVKLAIDDFGTGYSSLSYLRSFPVDSIKIDQSFIAELHRSPTSTALIEAVVNLSRALGASTVAEGIEHDDQAELLHRLGCNRAQGFYYCRPLPAPALTQLLKEHSSDETEPLTAWRVSSERVQERLYDIEVRHGLDDLARISRELEELGREVKVPIMGTWPWLQTWGQCFPQWEPMMIGVRSAESGVLTASALLATRERAEGTAIVAMGHGSSLFTALHAVGPEDASALATAVASTLEDIDGAWSLDLEQMAEYDPVASHLSKRLGHVQLLPELRVPRVVFASAHGPENVLSKNMRKQIRRANAKIDRDGLDMSIAFDRGRAISAELIDEVESVHVQRDRDARRQSDLDLPSEREFWRRVVEGGKSGSEWEVEVATLRLDDVLAAYVVALLDGDTYRVYDGRMATEFADYSPGRLIESAALTRAMTDPRFAVLDWMSGVAAEKLLTTNMAEARSRLVATSGSRYMSFPKRSDYKKELTPA